MLRCISIAKSPDTFASEIQPILNSHRACGRLCLRIVVSALNCKKRRVPVVRLFRFQRAIQWLSLTTLTKYLILSSGAKGRGKQLKMITRLIKTSRREAIERERVRASERARE